METILKDQACELIKTKAEVDTIENENRNLEKTLQNLIENAFSNAIDPFIKQVTIQQNTIEKGANICFNSLMISYWRCRQLFNVNRTSHL